MISRVYVIDDDDQFRNSLCALIESVGLEVEGWSNPEDLLKKSSLHRPGCVVLDHRLPLLSGLEVLRIIRKTSSIPAILISAYADVQTAVAAMEMGHRPCSKSLSTITRSSMRSSASASRTRNGPSSVNFASPSKRRSPSSAKSSGPRSSRCNWDSPTRLLPANC